MSFHKDRMIIIRKIQHMKMTRLDIFMKEAIASTQYEFKIQCVGWEGRTSFLKKRSKGLLSILVRTVAGSGNKTDGSFLVLF